MSEPGWDVGICVFVHKGIMRRRLADFFMLSEFYRARGQWLVKRPLGDKFVDDIYHATQFPSEQHADDYMRAGYPSADYDLYRVRSYAVLISETRVQTRRTVAFLEQDI